MQENYPHPKKSLNFQLAIRTLEARMVFDGATGETTENLIESRNFALFENPEELTIESQGNTLLENLEVNSVNHDISSSLAPQNNDEFEEKLQETSISPQNHFISIKNSDRYVFSKNDFSKGYLRDQFSSIKIVSLPKSGSLTFSGSEVHVNQSINVSDLSSLVYAPSFEATKKSSSAVRFYFQVKGKGESEEWGEVHSVIFSVTDVRTLDNYKVIDLYAGNRYHFDRDDFRGKFLSEWEEYNIWGIKILSLPEKGEFKFQGGKGVQKGKVLLDESIHWDNGGIPNLYYEHTHGTGLIEIRFKFIRLSSNVKHFDTQEYSIIFNINSLNKDSNNQAPQVLDNAIDFKRESFIEDQKIRLFPSETLYEPDEDSLSQVFLNLSYLKDKENVVSDIINFSSQKTLFPETSISIREIPYESTYWNKGIMLSGKDSVSNYNKILESLYLSIYDKPRIAGERIINLSVLDDKGNRSDQDIKLVLHPIKNHKPWANGKIINMDEDSISHINISDFGYHDEEGDPFVAVEITSLPEEGKFLLDQASVIVGQRVEVSDIHRLSYQPEENKNGDFSFEYNVLTVDEVKSKSGSSILFDVKPINDAPVGMDNRFALEEDSSWVFKEKHFGYSDVEKNAFSAVEIVEIPLKGSLVFNETPVQNGDIINVSDIHSLLYSPESDESGNDYTRLGFRVISQDGLKDTKTRYISFDVDAVNDAPVLQSDPSFSLSWSEGQAPLQIFISQYLIDQENHSLQALTVQIANIQKDDHLIINGLNKDSYFEDTSILVTRNDDTGMLTLTGDASILEYNKVLQAIRFINHSENPSQEKRKIDISFSDSLGAVGGGTVFIDVWAENDLPSGLDKTIDLRGKPFWKFDVSHFGYSDAEGDEFLAIKIVNLPEIGALFLNDMKVTIGQRIKAGDIDNLIYYPVRDQSLDFSSQIEFTVISVNSKESLPFHIRFIGHATEKPFKNPVRFCNSNDGTGLKVSVYYPMQKRVGDKFVPVLKEILPQARPEGNKIKPGDYALSFSVDKDKLLKVSKKQGILSVNKDFLKEGNNFVVTGFKIKNHEVAIEKGYGRIDLPDFGRFVARKNGSFRFIPVNQSSVKTLNAVCTISNGIENFHVNLALDFSS